MCAHYCFVQARRKHQNNMFVSESPSSIFYNRTMIGRCGITHMMIMKNNKKKRIQLMEDDWLKDLQGDAFRWKGTYECSVVPKYVTFRYKAYRPAMI